MALFGCNNDDIQVRAGEGGAFFTVFFYPNITSLTTFHPLHTPEPQIAGTAWGHLKLNSHRLVWL
jgi:hypothetical protein